ncbi:hypothetical protein PR202_ga16573 [Eleusine coracana subsp. coracana]|uniref:non-specific serine/threonine protein kinase n=1 Tax=Eleusine coracana subsp. coracana TaxID=191504 RepID=A0AAV5CN49_ELECO|nr:hypothetical protein PR202_ga16573 [Eleusine coracana subsp. coracana]
MKLSACTVVVLYLLFLLLTSCEADDRIVPGKPLNPGDVIVSDAGVFALGFFSPSNSTPTKLYLGIWYNGIPDRTVVWVANREIPVHSSRDSSSSGPTLAVTNTSNLVLFDADGRVAWTTTTSSGTANSTAVLLNNGNLVLRSPNVAMLWQSFDHPTDTHLPEMKLRINYGVRPGDRLVSWRSPSDPAPGSFSYGGDPDTFLQTFVWNGSRPLWRSGVWTGYRVYTEYVANISAIIYISVVDIDDNAYVAFSLSNGASLTRYVVSHAGKMMLQSWNDASRRWDVLGVMPRTDCNSYGHCGPFGYCDNVGGEVRTCKCLQGFEPTNDEEWRHGRFSQGCRRKEALRCGVDGDGFLALPGMKAPDRFLLVDNKSFDECAAECHRNCSCVAYAYANLSSSYQKKKNLTSRPVGDPTRCLVYMEELIDTEKIGAAAAASETLYLRLTRLPTEYAMRGIFSVKSDVYSFGVLILEIVSGVKISSTDHIMGFENLLDYAWNLWNEEKTKDLIDPSIVDSCVTDEALLCIHLGLSCVQGDPNVRPLMSSVVFILENGSTTLPVPDKPIHCTYKINEIEQITGDILSSKNSVTLSVVEGR